MAQSTQSAAEILITALTEKGAVPEPDLDPNAPVLPVDLTGDEPHPVRGQHQVPAPSVPSLDVDSLMDDWEDEPAGARPKSVAAPPAIGESRTVVPPPPAAPAAELLPVLPLDAEEPAPVMASSVAQALKPDAQAMETLKRLAGAAADPERARAALTAAVSGQQYDARALPEPRAMALGLARLLATKGIAVDEIVEAIMGALLE